MKRFTQALVDCLQEPKTNRKIEIISAYLSEEDIENLPIAFHLLIGENFGRFCSSKLLRSWCAEQLQLPEWLIDESYEALGDNSETIALCLSHNHQRTSTELHQIYQEMLELKDAPIDTKKEWVTRYWGSLPSQDIYTFNKLLGGGIRIGASKKNVLKALSQISNIDPETLEHRLLGNWTPNQISYQQLISAVDHDETGIRPYPFFLASPIQGDLQDTINNINDWIVEPKWDGIRAQLVHRPDGIALWSRGNDLISHQFPEIITAASQLDFGVYDGEILVWKDDQPQPFFELQKRLNRKRVTETMMKALPCIMKLYDCMEINGTDIRQESIIDRRNYLTNLNDPFYLSEPFTLSSIDELESIVKNARSDKLEGVIIKRKMSTYQSGRIRGDWWKLKVEPLTLDVVIMYAQKGRGIRSGLYTDYTFGVWDDDQLVPIGKAYSGLTNQEIKEVNKIIKDHLTDKFGPVRAMVPCVVLEVAFDDIQPSSRHKSGLALRFPRIHRLRLDKPIKEANTIEDARMLCKHS